MAQQVTILLVGGPLSGLKMPVDGVEDNRLFVNAEGSQLLCYERDEDSLNYYFSATKTNWFNKNHDVAMFVYGDTFVEVEWQN